MKNYTFILLMLTMQLVSCQKEHIAFETNSSETIYLDNEGASMRMLIEGNTASRTFLLFVHGGPGTSSFFYNTTYISSHIEDKYAVIYLDQRNAGASQGGMNKANLSLEQMTEDLKKAIELIRYRYGNSSRIFMLGHSFGGLLSASFMTNADYQNLINGWIISGGSHNYPLNNIVTRDMLLTVGKQQLLEDKSEKWEEIVAYCKTLPDVIGQEQADQLNSYAAEAEALIEHITPFNAVRAIKTYGRKDKWPIFATFLNHRNTQSAAFNAELAKTEFSSKLYKVTQPTLLMFGKYDFICPPELGEDISENISTSDQKLVIFDNAGHNIMFQDEVGFCAEINAFIESH